HAGRREAGVHDRQRRVRHELQRPRWIRLSQRGSGKRQGHCRHGGRRRKARGKELTAIHALRGWRPPPVPVLHMRSPHPAFCRYRSILNHMISKLSTESFSSIWKGYAVDDLCPQCLRCTGIGTQRGKRSALTMNHLIPSFCYGPYIPDGTGTACCSAFSAWSLLPDCRPAQFPDGRKVI